MRLKICSGYPLSSPKGNSVTAKRIERLMRDRGVEAEAIHTERVECADSIIALHAIKTSSVVLKFAEENPDGKIHVVLTGTDIHQGIHEQKDLAEKVFRVADTLVVSHPECIHEVPSSWRAKVKVIYPSVEIPDGLTKKVFRQPTFTCLAHLRQVKNSHQLARALELIPNKELKAILLGNALENSESKIAQNHARRDQRFSWVEGVGREEALSYMKGSTATLNTSLLEGGANTVVEAIALGVPVLASRIDGNVGLLGADYKGLYDVRDDKQLANLIQKCLECTEFTRGLKAQLKERSSLFSTESEMNSWIELLQLFSSRH